MENIKIAAFFEGGVLKRMPRKKELRLLILHELCKGLCNQTIYSEQEINAYLKPLCFDFVELRRYLIDYQFLIRNCDGSEYRLYHES